LWDDLDAVLDARGELGESIAEFPAGIVWRRL